MDPWLLEKLVHYIYDLFVGYTNIYYFLALLKNGNFANLSQIAIVWTVKILSADYVPGLHTIAQMSERWGGVFGCFFKWNLSSKKVFDCLLKNGLNDAKHDLKLCMKIWIYLTFSCWYSCLEEFTQKHSQLVPNVSRLPAIKDNRTHPPSHAPPFIHFSFIDLAACVLFCSLMLIPEIKW